MISAGGTSKNSTKLIHILEKECGLPKKYDFAYLPVATETSRCCFFKKELRFVLIDYNTHVACECLYKSLIISFLL